MNFGLICYKFQYIDVVLRLARDEEENKYLHVLNMHTRTKRFAAKLNSFIRYYGVFCKNLSDYMKERFIIIDKAKNS